jgi:hypothetical protein
MKSGCDAAQLGWSCQQCTLRNDAHMMYCVVCGALKKKCSYKLERDRDAQIAAVAAENQKRMEHEKEMKILMADFDDVDTENAASVLVEFVDANPISSGNLHPSCSPWRLTTPPVYFIAEATKATSCANRSWLSSLPPGFLVEIFCFICEINMLVTLR